MTMNKTFAIIGIGYIAERHLQAIKENNGYLVAAHDISDSVGILDRYFPDAKFFTDKAEFDEYCKGVDYYVICTPNYLHYEHIKIGLNVGKNVICEKPIVFNMAEYEDLKKDKGRIFQILQYRSMPEVIALKNCIFGYTDCMIYCNSYRGDWYHKSWKGDTEKSGGLVFNIGIHMLDLASFLFGDHIELDIIEKTKTRIALDIRYENARVICELSISEPEPKRILKLNGTEIDLNKLFVNSHSLVYENILNNSWYSITDSEDALNMAYDIKQESLC